MKMRLGYPKVGPRLLAKQLGRTRAGVIQRAKVLGIRFLPLREETPSIAQYRAMLREECGVGNISLSQALSKSRARPAVMARWRTFERLRRMDFSYPAIGSAVGCDHTVIVFACQRMAEIRAAKSVNTLDLSSYE